MSIDYDKIATHIPDIVDFDMLKKYAVAICLVKGKDGMEIVFEERGHKMKHQPGDICLPGGRIEPEEEPEQAVIRELCEELLIKEEQIKVLGTNDIYMTGKGRVLYPFVVELSGYENTFNRDEVEEIFRIPVSYFEETEPEEFYTIMEERPEEDFPFERIYGGKDYPWSRSKRRIVFYQFEKWTIWGMTGKIMESFSKLFLRTGEKKHETDY